MWSLAVLVLVMLSTVLVTGIATVFLAVKTPKSRVGRVIAVLVGAFAVVMAAGILTLDTALFLRVVALIIGVFGVVVITKSFRPR